MGWEPLSPKGKGPGPISHHKCAVFDDKMILVGGLIGDDSNSEIYMYDSTGNHWHHFKT